MKSKIHRVSSFASTKHDDSDVLIPRTHSYLDAKRIPSKKNLVKEQLDYKEKMEEKIKDAHLKEPVQLVEGGKWIVSIEDRPKGWEKWRIKE